MAVELTDVEAKKETEKAILCDIDGKEMWIPKSQIDDDSEVFEEGHYGTLIITDWIAEQKELGG